MYLMKDVPIYEFNVQKLLVRSSYKGQDMGRLGLTPAEFAAADKMPEAFVAKLKLGGVQFLDPIPLLMARSNSDKFLPFDSGGSFYYDGNHLSTYGSLALKPLFAPIFQNFGVQSESGGQKLDENSARGL